MDRETATLEELDKRSFLHPFTSIPDQLAHGPHVMRRAEGCRVWDRAGREYLDAMAGLWCVNVGYGRREISDAIARQARELPYFHSFAGMANEPAILLADRLGQMAPGSLDHVFFGCTGSDANDTQVKLVWYYNNLRGKPEKKKIVSRRGAYHGVTATAASLTGLPHLHKAFDLPLPGFLHTARPHHYWDAEEGMSEEEFSSRLATELEELIEEEGGETVAAFVAEPVMGAGGVVVPPAGYFDAIVPVLRRHDVLLICDEVICGFGRLGHLFGCQHYDFQPDLMTVAKGLTSGYVPMSAVLISDEIWQVLRDGTPEVGLFAHGYTYSAHPLAARAALANLDLFEAEDLVQRAAATGGSLQRRLREAFAEDPIVGEVRGVGMVAAIEIVADKEKRTPFEAATGPGKRLQALALEEGLISRCIGNAACFAPPLILAEEEVEEIVDKFGRALTKLKQELRRGGEWSAA